MIFHVVFRILITDSGMSDSIYLDLVNNQNGKFSNTWPCFEQT